MWTLVGLAVVLAVAAGVLPLPVWASRASRAVGSAKPQRALNPAPVVAEHGLAELLSEVAIAVDVAQGATRSMADYAAAALWVRWMDYGSSDNWAKSVVRRALYDEGEAYAAAARVLETADEVPEDLRDNLDAALSTLVASQHSVDGLIATDARPGAHLSSAAVRKRLQRLERLRDDLLVLHDAIASPPNDPYRA